MAQIVPPTPVLDIARGIASLDEDIPRVLAFLGKTAIEELGWRRPNKSSLIVPIQSTLNGVIENYVLRLGFAAYRRWPPSAQFVNPNTLAYAHPVDQHHLPNGTVCYVVSPRQQMRWGNYHVSAEALAEVVHRVPEGWKPLAQVHSHPGKWVEHSSYDDEMVSSHRILSLVFPSYGRKTRGFLHGVGVHEWQNGNWHRLDPDSAKKRICPSDREVRVEDMR